MDDCCAVCAEPLEWVAYGPCLHREVCSTCVARLRFICDDRRAASVKPIVISSLLPRYIDDDHVVVSFKKQDPDLKWPDIMESWESLAAGSSQLLKGTSIYLVGDSTEINQRVAEELATGLGYTPLSMQELLESYSNQTVDSWLLAESSDSVAEGEGVVLESISSC